MFLNRSSASFGFLKQGPVAIKNMRHEIVVVFPPGALVHFGVERGEKKILQDGLVKNGFLVSWPLPARSR